MKTGTNGHPPDFAVSVVRAAHETATSDTSFRAILSGISNGRWKKQVDTVRAAYSSGGKDAADAPKRKLPGVLFSGTFTKRSASALAVHSGLICADLDHLADLDGYREHIVADPHVLACFVSPTGTGLKVIFRCDPARPHLESFKAAEHYVLENFGLEIDQACKDVSRLCFVSHDPEAFIAGDAQELPYPATPVEFTEPSRLSLVSPGELHPGDDFDLRGDFQSILLKNGWEKFGTGGWTRPGKTSGLSATWDKVPGRFYVFSSEAQPFEPGHTYRPWHVFALLEHGGDFRAAAQALYAAGYGKRMVGHLKLEDEPANLQGAPPGAVAAVGLHRAKGRSIFDFSLVPDTHESVLLGHRYLNRGDGAIVTSTSGMGKSTLSLQMATELALNLGPLGIRGNGPLRSLIVQSEDGEGDIGEVAYSLKHILKLSQSQIEDANSKVYVFTDRVNRGARFLAALKDYIKETKPDLVWLNPLQAFMDGDITISKDLGAFLREGLNGVNSDARFAYMLVHHTTKPATGKDRAERLWHEVMYDMAGGADLINWARAILSLRAAPTEGDFNLVLAKRGRRAGVTRKVPQGVGYHLEPVTTIPLRHCKERVEVAELSRPLPLMFWQPREPDAAVEKPKGGRPSVHDFSDYRNLFPKNDSPGMELGPLHSSLRTNKEIKRDTLFHALKRWSEDGLVEILSPEGRPKRYRAAI